MQPLQTLDDLFGELGPGLRPALVKGMFVEVELTGTARPDTLVVPRAAVHGDDGGAALVYVVDGDSRLRRKPVEIAFEQGDFVVIEGGIGENIEVTH